MASLWIYKSFSNGENFQKKSLPSVLWALCRYVYNPSLKQGLEQYIHSSSVGNFPNSFLGFAHWLLNIDFLWCHLGMCTNRYGCFLSNFLSWNFPALLSLVSLQPVSVFSFSWNRSMLVACPLLTCTHVYLPMHKHTWALLTTASITRCFKYLHLKKQHQHSLKHILGTINTGIRPSESNHDFLVTSRIRAQSSALTSHYGINVCFISCTETKAHYIACPGLKTRRDLLDYLG